MGGDSLAFIIFSIASPRFAFRMRWASSNVIRCSRVSLSVAEPEVALRMPPTSELNASGWCLASERGHATHNDGDEQHC